jgi:DNA-binding LacI/PurR family transcriptional regulator
VASEQLAAGEALPSKRQFARDLTVAQMTLQRAIGELIEHGVLESQPRQRVVVCAEGRERAQELLRQSRKSSGLERLTLLVHEWFAGVLADAPTNYWSIVIYQLKAEAALQGLETTVVPFPIKGQVEFIHTLADRSNNVSVALGVSYEQLPALYEASRSGIPLLLHNRGLPWLHLPAVLRDDYAAAWRIGEILRGLGHSNMCMLSPEWFTAIMARDRMEGWWAFLHESGLFPQCNPAVITMRHMNEQQAFLRRLLRGPEAPTAVVFTMPLAHLVFDPDCCGPLDIPRQLSVVNWDDVVQVGRPGAEVPCTSVHVDHRRMSQCIIEMARKIQAGDLCPPSVRVRCDIEVTDSIGPPRPPDRETHLYLP